MTCGRPATHKVSEVIQWDDPAQARHPLTAYVCCSHFFALVGSAAPCDVRDDVDLPRWIDDEKGKDPLVDDLIAEIINLRARLLGKAGSGRDLA
jgi:hypothetical protein